MLLEHERYHGLGMDALRPVCSWNTNVIMVWELESLKTLKSSRKPTAPRARLTNYYPITGCILGLYGVVLWKLLIGFKVLGLEFEACDLGVLAGVQGLMKATCSESYIGKSKT